MHLCSFRDPAGHVALVGGRVFRTIAPSSFPEFKQFLDSAAAKSLIGAGELIPTKDLSEGFNGDHWHLPADIAETVKGASHLVEHDRVWFPSYPYEWPPEMLFAAGQLTLHIAETIVRDGFRLKDASPYNVLFCGPKPVFVDVLSFEERPSEDPYWIAYGQFLRMFILPLLSAETFGTTPAEIFLNHRDGIESEAMYRNLSWPRRLKPPFLSTVSIPSWLGGGVSIKNGEFWERKRRMPADKAEYVFRSQLRRANKLLQRVEPATGKKSVWSSYTDSHSYKSEDYSLKKEIAEQWLKAIRPETVLDVGSNTGEFSEIAARAGSRVLAIDVDPVASGTTWRRARANNLDILPLVVNFAWPTPAMGWRNAEYASFLDRAADQFDVVILLAVLHHLLVTERIPLQQVADVCAKLTKSYMIIEYVSKEDEMFRVLARGRDALHRDFTQEAFEHTFKEQFEFVDKRQVKGNFRWLYLFRKKTG
jgi:SAM-dependent methyltransferase